MSRDALAPGSAGLHLVGGLSLLRPEEQVFEAMLEGWRNQQLARNLAFSTIDGRHKAVKAFTRHADAFPWTWSAQMLDEWLGDLRALRDLKRSTLRGYSEAVRSFCAYLTDPAYGWPTECETRFATHPIQIAHEWNTAVHLQEAESDPAKRAFTRAELAAFFDHADGQIHHIRGHGRKGWLPAFRDATLFKTAYAFGLRRNETRMLDLVDFSRNPHAPAFGDFGVCQVRHGKAKKGSPPKRRGVLTIGPRHGTGGMDWIVDVLEQWTEQVRPAFAHADSPALWPSERGPRIGFTQMNTRFAAYRDAIGLDPALDFHSLRRSYVTHLIEDGWDARFVQEQVGHEHASTTALYTCVSSDFRIRTLLKALDQTTHAALNSTGKKGNTR
ncbi:integrase [Nocardiopsis sp. CNR-923]|uniref:tyrosine-type recombinase/integrase n=1 Tax=Nocardiopsis sp. CNR-923 TaxID=1904965 RepID=UPI00095BC410|nr:site-specific integrase [Nocardiopsis sp. CNR-923]OLT30463.1 integrase [Nocardiopsis sp. CNR-923]